MKIILPTIVFLICFQSHAQLDVEHSKNAWKRTSYEIWDDFAPFWYFLFTDFEKDDKRTMYSRAGAMTLWAIYADEYEMHKRTIDSTYQQEVHKALDRTLNKNYLVLQRPRALDLFDQIELRIESAADTNLPDELLTIYQNRYLAIIENIDYLKSAYAPDSNKYPLVEDEIKNLENLLSIGSYLELLGALWEADESEVPSIDYDDAIELNQQKIEALIKN